MLAMIMQRSQIAPTSMQLLVRITHSDGQSKHETGNPQGPFGSTLKTKPASLKSETPHEIGEQLS